MIALSLLLVALAIGVIQINLDGQGAELRFGYQQMIHARVPWLLLGVVWGGCALGIASILRKRALYKFPVVALEIAVAAYLSWYVGVATALPERELRVELGDAFPAYSLVDHEGRPALYDGTQNDDPGPALYIFYRGDW